jgi:hypothetical protein
MDGAGWEKQDKTVTQVKPGSDPGFQAQLPTAKKYAFSTRLSNLVFLASSAQKKVDAMNLVRPGSANKCAAVAHQT